jgi:hypothetical protein
MRDPEIESARKAIADDAGAERGNTVTHEAADDKTPDDDGPGTAETPSADSVRTANAAGVNPEKS